MNNNEPNILIIPFNKDEVNKRKWAGMNNKTYHSITILNKGCARINEYIFLGIQSKVRDTHKRYWLHFLINNKQYRVISHNNGMFVCVRFKETDDKQQTQE